MVNWSSPTEIARDAAAFGKFMHVLLGLYLWEWFISLSFDWQYVTGKKSFRWPLLIYFANRYSLLFALIGIAIALNVTTEIDCQALYTFNQCFGNAAIGFASISLAFRTMAVWGQKWYIIAPLIAIILGHWSLLLHGVLLKAVWVPNVGCVITSTDNRLLAITFIYTMVFDFIVLCLTAFKLAVPGGGSRSRLVQLIFGDGLIFFIIAFLANLIATIFMLLDLNPVMSIIANVPAAIASTIVACRAVRRLTNFTNQGPEIFATSTHGETLTFRTNQTQTQTLRPKMSVKKTESVHVQMSTFKSPDSRTSTEYDASGKVVTGDESYDAEAQGIRNEFKHSPY